MTAAAHAARAADPRPTSDVELVERACAGEAAAFEQIMRRHNRLLFRSVRGIVTDDAEAQDVVQDTYLRAFAALPGFRRDSALGTWLARIAIRLAIDAQRRLGRLVSLDEGDEHDPVHAGPFAENRTMPTDATAAESPETEAARGQMRTILQRAIDGLPVIYRSVFILRAVEELSVEETADCLQISADLVKTRYLRARAKLRDALGAALEADAAQVYAFAGARCDAVVEHVLVRLRREGRLRGPG